MLRGRCIARLFIAQGVRSNSESETEFEGHCLLRRQILNWRRELQPSSNGRHVQRARRLATAAGQQKAAWHSAENVCGSDYTHGVSDAPHHTACLSMIVLPSCLLPAALVGVGCSTRIRSPAVVVGGHSFMCLVTYETSFVRKSRSYGVRRCALGMPSALLCFFSLKCLQ